MQSKFVLEVCAFNIQSCLVAERIGAARVELCADPLQGGTTPAYGVIKQARERLSIRLYPIIRPREGDFFYDADEFSIIKKDIQLCKEIGCDGISTGLQLQNGEVDTERLKKIVEWAYPMGVTFHRAFDTTPDAFKALEDIIDCGCERILTSGQKKAAAEATDMLAKLIRVAQDRVIIMPGGGIRAHNIEKLKGTGAKEFHTSARVAPQPPSIDINLFDPGSFYIADEQELRKVMAYL
jgi:copper homeostasis protein